MTIEQIIKYLPAPICCDTILGKEKQKEYEAHDSAVIILRKYQKIEDIYKRFQKDGGYYHHMARLVDALKEVLEDGNDD